MLSRRHHLLCTICYAAIIFYGSLVPFHFQPLSIGELLEQFKQVCTSPIRLTSRSDFLANVLLFVPLSFLALGTLSLNQRLLPWLLLIPVSLGCTLFGAFVEFLQLMFPPRNSSLNDILAQLIGSFTGTLLWVVAGSRLIKSTEAFSKRYASRNRLIPFLLIYLLLIIVLESVPFDFTLSPVELVHKWREGRIHLIPFAAFLDPDRNMPTKTAWNIVQFLPLGLMLGFGKDLRGYQAAGLGLLMAGGVEVLQLLVLGRHFEPTDIITGSLAVFSGWSMMLMRDGSANNRSIKHLLLLAWAILVCWVNWTPFDFTTSGAENRLHEISLIPFADYQQKHYLSAFDDLIHKLILFMLLGVMLSLETIRKPSAAIIFLTGTLIAGVIEAGQIFLPTRYPSSSDVVLGAVGAVMGHLIVSSYQASKYARLPLEASLHL
ncbi:MAG: VanZ family protein [Gemmatales bacterium]